MCVSQRTNRRMKRTPRCGFIIARPGRGVGKEIDGGAGFYVHLNPEGREGRASMPPRPSLAKVRDHFSEDLAGGRAVTAPAVLKRFGGLVDDEDGILPKRLPRGFEYPAERWLRFNSFTMHRMYSDAEMLSPKLVDMAMKDFGLLGADVQVAQSGAWLPAGKAAVVKRGWTKREREMGENQMGVKVDREGVGR